MKKNPILILASGAFLMILAGNRAHAQKIETVNGVRIVHNVKGGTWGAKPQVSLKLVRTYGDYDIEDEHLAFNLPSDALLDRAGNLYVLDSSNRRIQKFGPDGKYLATIGRKGQGPGEFNYPNSFDFGADGNLYVLETGRRIVHVFSPDGKELKSVRWLNSPVNSIRYLGSNALAAVGVIDTWPDQNEKKPKAPAKLVKVLDFEGKAKQEMGDPFDFGDPISTGGGNSVFLEADAQQHIYLTFRVQNRVEKYSPEGKLLWRADRPLNFKTDMIKKGRFEQSKTSASVWGPQFNDVSSGLAVDGKGRVWVITFRRQLKDEERISTSKFSDTNGNITTKVEGDQERPIKDLLALDVFDPNGVLLGSLPLDFFVGHIRIFKDDLLLIDSERLSKVYHFKIVENKA
jgi:hypothetical protein